MTIYPILWEQLLLELNINAQENSKFSSWLVVAAGAAVASHPYIRVRLLRACVRVAVAEGFFLWSVTNLTTKDESTHRLHLYPLGGVFYSP